MIVYINHRYKEWAEWCLRGRSSGLGYPSQCAFSRLTPSSSARGLVPIDSDAWEVEQCVQRLEPEEVHLVKEFYLRTSVPVETIAKDLHCHRDTVYARLHTVHNKTLGWLNDLSAGVSLPAIRRVNKLKRGSG